MCAVSNKAVEGLHGMAIGGVIGFMLLSVSSKSASAFNPARVYCPYILDPNVAMNHWWVWIWLVGEMLGAISAAYMCEWFINDELQTDNSKKMDLIGEEDYDEDYPSKKKSLIDNNEIELQSKPIDLGETQELDVNVDADIEVEAEVDAPPPVVIPTFPDTTPPVNNEIKWTGHFMQNDEKYDMDLRNMIIEFDGTVSGSGSDAVGDFTIEGQLTDGVLEFKKQYDAHFVNYKGQDTDNSGNFNGTWEIPGDVSGDFSIHCDIPKWSGYYVQGGQQNEMALDMTISQEGVYGHGTDVNGFFVCRGECKDNGDVIFRKQYVGKWALDYFGKYQDGKVTGKWYMQGEEPEEFEITMS